MRTLKLSLICFVLTTLVACSGDTSDNTTSSSQTTVPTVQSTSGMMDAAGKKMPAQTSAATTLASTQYGQVRGSMKGDIYVFKGVRYGADTATTRFAAPAAPEVWPEPADATVFGNSCPQTPIGSGGGLFASWAPQPTPALDEDCLFLNIWTPALKDGAKRPVMVWLHGGGFTAGNGASNAYEGTRLAKRGDVVVVTLNHRLNVFGYLALNNYGPGFEDSSVAGMLDIVLALKWVQANIENFGGDPETVMIFGESGGGAKVSTLMSTDAAKGLFHRAVVQSGAMLRFPEQDKARAAADKVVENLGLTKETIAQIKTLPAEDIRKAFAGTGAATAPSIDGKTLTQHPFTPGAAPQGKHVPLMLGSNRTESSIFVGATNPAIFDLTWKTLPKALQAAMPEKDVQAIIAGYRDIDANLEPADIYFEATTDARWLAGHITQAERKVMQGGAPTYLYLFNWDTPVEGGKWRSPHALEIGFVFDNVANSESMSGVGVEQQKVADILADTWIAFARTGNPNNSQIPNWLPYNLEERPVMVLDEKPELVNNPRAAQRALVNDGAAYGNRYQGE